MSTPDSTPSDYAGLSKQEVAERLKNPTPDATATPRTDADKLATELIVWSSLPLGAGINQYEFSRVAREAAKLLRELTAAKAQLRERTQWQCKCGGTDCAGMKENERLRAEVERLSGVKNQLERTGFQTVTQLADAWLNHQNTFKSQTAYVAEVEARETQLRSSVDAMEADKARLDWLERELPREQALLRACTEAQIPVSIFRRNEPITRAAIDAARAGKGAT